MTKKADFREPHLKSASRKQKHPVSAGPIPKKYRETVLTYSQVLDDQVLYEAIRSGTITLVPDKPDS